MTRRVTIANLAPTGEGVARTADGVGFVAGALPGEEVEAQVTEIKKRFWKGRTVSVLSRSPDRRSGPHAAGCASCDWAHFDLSAARRSKRELFLETMERIGELPREPFGPLLLAPSPAAYRLRNRFHISGRGESVSLGYFAPRSHRVEPADGCEALTEGMRTALPRIREAIAASGVAACEIATVESLDGMRRLARLMLPRDSSRSDANAVVAPLAGLFDGLAVREEGGTVLAKVGERRLWLAVGSLEFPVTAETFFQSNRFLVEELSLAIRQEAACVPAGRALDAFGGVGFFAGALLDAGHSVVSVEGNGAAVEQALAARKRWGDRAWTVVHSAVLSFLATTTEPFDFVVADPPRGGLGQELARALAGRTAGPLVYVSCEPATLARDLPVFLAEGFEIRGARLYDLFALTHRIEAVVTLGRGEKR